jgi:hypothetical protein
MKVGEFTPGTLWRFRGMNRESTILMIGAYVPTGLPECVVKHTQLIMLVNGDELLEQPYVSVEYLRREGKIERLA